VTQSVAALEHVAAADDRSRARNDSAMAALGRLVAPVKGRLVLAFALSGLSGVLRVVALILAARVAANLIADAGDRPWTLLTWMGASAVAATLFKNAASTVSHHAAFDHEVILRRWLTEHLGRLPIGTVQRIGAGGLKKVIQDDVRGLHAMVADTPPSVGALVTAPIVGIAAMFVIDWRLALVSLAVVPLVVGLMSYLMRDYPEQQRRYDAAQESINGAVVEYVQGMAEVRTFDGGSSSFTTFVQRNTEFTEMLRQWTERTRAGALVVRILLAPLPVIVLVTAVGSIMAGAGLVEPTDLVAIILLSPLLVESAFPLMWMMDSLNRSKVSAIRIDEVLAMEPLAEPDSPLEPVDGSIRFESVTYAYDDNRRPALEDVSFEVPSGTVCALVGPSGSGKSTVARLVPRFFDVDLGRILVGGVDVREMSTERLLRQVALVFQEPFLITGTVRENLAMGNPAADQEAIEAAARAARAHHFILELPQGYDTVVGERGASLSGGQRQRITIARALLSDAPIVILDEATSFADPENEAEIQMALAELTRGRTVLVVAHRLSTIADADQIVVLDRGKLVEAGPHDRLVETGGFYAGMWAKHQQAMSWGIRLDRETTS
jgi:ATP-binding cassette, subfamily B, bacterial IrtA/YbtP